MSNAAVTALTLTVLLACTAVIAVCIRMLQGKLEIRMIPSEEIQAMIRFIKSNPGYADLLTPKDVAAAEKAARETFRQYQKVETPTQPGDE